MRLRRMRMVGHASYDFWAIWWATFTVSSRKSPPLIAATNCASTGAFVALYGVSKIAIISCICFAIGVGDIDFFGGMAAEVQEFLRHHFAGAIAAKYGSIRGEFGAPEGVSKIARVYGVSTLDYSCEVMFRRTRKIG